MSVKPPGAIANSAVKTRAGRPMPLYLSDEDVGGDDHYSHASLHASKDELEDVTPDGHHEDVARKDLVRAPHPGPHAPHGQVVGLPMDGDADDARGAIPVRAGGDDVIPAAFAVPPGRSIDPREAAQSTLIVGDHGEGGPGPGPEIMAADTLQGDRVMNRQGELLGKIRDIMIDVRRGRIAYAVMSSGGVMGFGDRLYALPWSALTLDAAEHCFVLDVTRERLQAAPGFDRERWPSMADASFTRSVHEYYGRPWDPA